MSFKIHLIVVSIIIAVVFLAWGMVNKAPAPAPVVAASPTSQYSIAVTHATWGLNCRFLMSEEQTTTTSDSFANTSDTPVGKLREDNVLSKVSALCNGQLSCNIPINAATLGEDPLPDCREKLLEVEYRCFSYDRPWIAKESLGTLKISCDKKH